MRIKYQFLFCLCIFSGLAMGMTLEEQRSAYRRVENIAVKSSNAQFKSAVQGLENYPLFPYLNYLRLKSQLHHTRAIKHFLKTEADSRYAGFLRRKWLKYLAKRQHWKTYLHNYQNTSNTSLQCYYHWAQYKNGKKRDALIAAKKLWVVGRSQPKSCDTLFSKLVVSKYLTKEMIWQRFALALEKGKLPLAKYLQRLLGKKDQKIASFWIKVHRQPNLIKQNKHWQQRNALKGLIFAHGVHRMARRDPVAATKVWDSRKQKLKIDQQRARKLEKRLALALAFRKNKQAYNRLKQLHHKDDKVREWQVRAALNEQKWHAVNTSLALLPTTEKAKDRWHYWQAKAYSKTGKKQESKLMFKQLAKRRSYYGFLAADHLHLDFQMRDHPVVLNRQQKHKLLQNKHFRVVNEFKQTGNEGEAKRNWWHAVKHASKAQKISAAKLAEQWGWVQKAIFTIARAKHWDDIKLRFPVVYSDKIRRNAKLNKLDPAIVFGLIRRESAFDKNARSPVGARGLMQIMPRTGRQIARALKEKWRSKNTLYNPDVNLKYGTYYYKKMLNKFDGHFALAAAAYNAGPHRVKKWLPENHDVPADIWIETIPFKETREYVAAVLSYAMIYQQRMGWNSLSIKDFMRDVSPG